MYRTPSPTFPTADSLGVEVLDHATLAAERRFAGDTFQRACLALYEAQRLHGPDSLEVRHGRLLHQLARQALIAAVGREIRAFGRLAD
jgi:hypothetical protein